MAADRTGNITGPFASRTTALPGQGSGGGGGISALATVLVASALNAPVNAVNLALLADGVLTVAVSGGVATVSSTPAIPAGTLGYFYNPGVAGGQHGAFDTAASAATGYFTSTNHATKGFWYLNAAKTIAVDETNVRFGIAQAAPDTALTIGGNILPSGTTAARTISVGCTATTGNFASLNLGQSSTGNLLLRWLANTTELNGIAEIKSGMGNCRLDISALTVNINVGSPSKFTVNGNCEFLPYQYLNVAAGGAWNGFLISSGLANFTANSAEVAVCRIQQSTLTGSTTTRTMALGATLIFDGEVVAGSNVAVTNNYTVYSKAGRWGLNPSITRLSAAGLVWDGFGIDAATLTLTGSNTVTQVSLARLNIPSIDSPSGCTVTNASTLTVEGAPAAGSGTTITNAYAVNVKLGVFRHVPTVTVASATGVWDGFRVVQGTCTFTGTATVAEAASTRFYQPVITNVSAGLVVTQAGTVVIDNAPSLTGNATSAAGPLGGTYNLWAKEGKACFTTAQDDFAVMKFHGMSTTADTAVTLAMEWSRRDSICGYLTLRSTFSEGSVSAYTFDLRFSSKVRIMDTSNINGGNVIFETTATAINANKTVVMSDAIPMSVSVAIAGTGTFTPSGSYPVTTPAGTRYVWLSSTPVA